MALRTLYELSNFPNPGDRAIVAQPGGKDHKKAKVTLMAVSDEKILYELTRHDGKSSSHTCSRFMLTESVRAELAAATTNSE